MRAKLLTPTELAYTLEISEYTVCALVHNGTIPHTYINSPATQERLLRFDPYVITEWMHSGPNLEVLTEKNYVDALKTQFKTNFPHVLTSLKTVNEEFSPHRKGKGYTLAKVTNKKYGFLYYVRYMERGKLVRSRWNTHTRNFEAATRFAQDNRERILTAYHAKHDGSQRFFDTLADFYREGSEYMTASTNRGRIIGEKARKEYHAFVTKTLIPFFKTHNVRIFDDVTKPVVENLQDRLLDLGRKPQTIWRLLCCLRQMFDFFVTHGTIQSNPFRGIVRIRPKSGDIKTHGCYEIDTLKGVFNKPWTNETSLLLCLVIYTTDMRNVEIERLRVKDIILMHQAYFFNISKSKTDNGVRIIPIHPFLYAKLQEHIAKNNLAPEDFLFTTGKNTYKKANAEMGRLMQKTPEELSALNITFYSGRCFWKTAMNVEKLGEVEEYFMGHKVSADVAKLYNHKDKTGRKNIAAKAKAVFKALDKYLGLDSTGYPYNNFSTCSCDLGNTS